MYSLGFTIFWKIGESELEKVVWLFFNNSFEFEQFSDAHYSQISNDLFEWKDDNSKIKSVKNVLNGSKYYEKFNEILLSFKNLK